MFFKRRRRVKISKEEFERVKKLSIAEKKAKKKKRTKIKRGLIDFKGIHRFS